MKKTLIVFYSHSGVTRNLAGRIKEHTSANICEIKPIHPYPDDVYETIEIFKQELKHKSTRPIKNPDIEIESFDTIFIGTPNWGNTVATPLLDFFSSVNIGDKTIIPFVTHGGGGVGNCATDIINLAGTKQSVTPLVVGTRGISDDVIKDWLQKIST